MTGRARRHRAIATVLLAAAAAVSRVADAQTAQAVRVSHDTGGAHPAGAPRRYGPPESVRRRDAQLEASVPAQYAPPAGMCRLWVQGVPPDRQPAPTECAKAVRVRSPNSQVVFGKSKPSARAGIGIPGGSGEGPGAVAAGGGPTEPAIGSRFGVGGVNARTGPVATGSTVPAGGLSRVPEPPPSAVHAPPPPHSESHSHSAPPPHAPVRPRR